MSLRIRLSRGGAKKRPYYRIVVADSRSPRDGRFIERIGSYYPMVAKDHPERVILKEDRIKHWLSVGAQPSDRVARFCSDAGLMDARARAEQTKKPLPKAKAQERMKGAEEARAAAAEEAAKKAEEETAEEEQAADVGTPAPAAEDAASDVVETRDEAAPEPTGDEAAAPEPAADDETTREPAADEEAKT